jgi:hypothetical protein
MQIILKPSLLCRLSEGFLRTVLKPNTIFIQFHFSEHMAY